MSETSPVENGALVNFSAIAEFFSEFPVRNAMRLMGMQRTDIAVCIGLSFIVTLLDGIMLLMLIPISYGLAAGNFSFMASWPGYYWLDSHIPQLTQSYSAMFLALAGLTFIIGVTKNSLRYLLYLATGHYYGHYSNRLNNFLFGRYLSFGKAYFDHRNTGELAKVLNYNHDLLGLFQGLFRLISETMLLVAYLTVLLVISWRLTLIVLLQFPILFAARRWISARIRKASEAVHSESKTIAHSSFNILASIPLYQTFAKEHHAVSTYQHVSERLRQSNFRELKYSGILAPVQDITMHLALLVILGLAFVVEDGGSAQISTMFVFFFVARLALPRLSVFHEVELEFESKLPCVREMFDLINDNKKFTVAEGSLELSSLKGAIEFRRLSFAYPDGPPVLNDINFSMEKGQMTTLVGPSGSGKTTVTNLLMRFYDFSDGEITISGHDIREYAIGSLRRRISLVNQDIILINDTLRNNLIFGLETDVSDEVMKRIITDAGLDEWIDSLKDGLNTKIGDRGMTLSGGQRQRVAIARALLRQAPILILDEATSSLDSLTEKKIQVAIDNAVKNCTSLVIAHRMSTIRRADKVVVLDSGRVVESGTLSDLLDQRGLFYSMWEAQKFD